MEPFNNLSFIDEKASDYLNLGRVYKNVQK